jgi:flagellar protein FlgJ
MNSSISSLLSSQQSLTPALTTDKNKGLKSACQQFESVFFGMMLKEMRKTVPTDPLLGDDAHEQEIFTGMMDDNVAQQMASHSGSDSLAQEMYKQLASKQGASDDSKSGISK